MRYKILMVDDDTDFVRLCKTVFTKKNYMLDSCDQAAKALALHSADKHDLIIVDGLLPDINGIEFIEQLRRAGDMTPIIFVSFFWRDLTTFNHLTRTLSVSKVLHKPFSPNELIVEIESILEPKEEEELKDEIPFDEAEVPEIEATLVEDPKQVHQSFKDAIDVEIEKLKDDYGQKLKEKLNGILDPVDEYLKGPQNPELLRNALLQVHKLRGSSGAYGYKEVSRCAGRVEENLSQLLQESHGRGQNGVWLDLSTHMEMLKAVVKQTTVKKSTLMEEASRRSPHVFTPRVLAVSNNLETIKILEGIRQGGAIDIIYARTGEKAIEYAFNKLFDTVLIELRDEKEHEAYQLATELRLLEGMATIPVIFFSENPSLTRQLAAIRAGATSFLFNRLNAADLIETVNRLSAGRRLEQPRVLIVDDDEDFNQQMSKILERARMTVSHLTEPVRILEVIEREKPDVLLLDVVMPHISGFEVCRLVRANPLWQDLPIIFIALQPSVDVRIACFTSGGDDFLQKPVVEQELITRINVRLERTRTLRGQGSKDPLTGLLTRKAFMDIMILRLAEIARTQAVLSVALIDIDLFKGINDKYGHMVGDRVLAALGKLMLNRMRKGDAICRWGGEEFLIAFHGQTKGEAMKALDRLLKEYGAIQFDGGSEGTFSVSFSGGIAQIPQDGVTLHEIVDAADERLYRAKNGGRNQIIT